MCACGGEGEGEFKPAEKQVENGEKKNKINSWLEPAEDNSLVEREYSFANKTN